MSGCDSRYDYEPETAESAQRIKQMAVDKAMEVYANHKKMTPVREQFLLSEKKTLTAVEIDQLMESAIARKTIPSSLVISLLQTLFHERYGDKFFQERITEGSEVAINKGYDTFAYTVREVHFDGTYRVRDPSVGSDEEHSRFVSVIRRGPKEPVSSGGYWPADKPVFYSSDSD